VSRHVGADENMIGVGRIDRNRADRAARRDRTRATPTNTEPLPSCCRRRATTRCRRWSTCRDRRRLGVTRAVRLTVPSRACSRRVIRIEHDRTDGFEGIPALAGFQLGLDARALVVSTRLAAAAMKRCNWTNCSSEPGDCGRAPGEDRPGCSAGGL